MTKRPRDLDALVKQVADDKARYDHAMNKAMLVVYRRMAEIEIQAMASIRTRRPEHE